jgi:DNA-binding HxlR family transcriptional regulator
MGKAYNVMAATCPSRTVLHRIGARWTVFVVNALDEYDENPPRVEYALTPLGRSLLVPLRAVRLWAEEHVPDIEAARSRQPIL